MKRTAFGIKKAYWFVPIIFLTLSACSSAADMEEETPFQDTTKIIADAAAKIVNGTEENKEVILKDITWGEADNFMDGTVLNLHFSDGTSVSREISGHVKNVEYIDFTGDETPEAVIYCHDIDNHTQTHIFEIHNEDKQLWELTPKWQIPEYEDEEWEISLLEIQKDNAQFYGLRFVGFSKETSCIDMERTFIYQDEKWERDQMTYYYSAEHVTKGNKAAALESILWNKTDFDFSSGTNIHFNFYDGTGMDQHIIGFAKCVKYIDFTGNGSKEAVVYSSYVTTATEYTLINIFQINDGKVKELTPETDIAEFAEELWSMSLIEVERDGIIYQGLELVSYDKMYALTYANKNMIIYYKNGRWELDKILYYDFDESWLEEWE